MWDPSKDKPSGALSNIGPASKPEFASNRAPSPEVLGKSKQLETPDWGQIEKEIERLREENDRLTENLAAIEAPCDSCSGDGTYELNGIPQVCPVCVPLGAVELIGKLAKLADRLAAE